MTSWCPKRRLQPQEVLSPWQSQVSVGWFSGGPSRVVGGCVLGLAQASAFTIIVPLAEERDAGMLAGGFQRWLLGIPKSKVVITSQK